MRGIEGPVNIGVEQTDRVAERFQRQREIDRRGRFADTAFARGDGDEGAHAGRQLFLGCGAAPRGRPVPVIMGVMLARDRARRPARRRRLLRR